MPITAQAILSAAAVWRGRQFSAAKYGENPYCASFVRWCFKQVNGSRYGLPEAKSVPYYQRKGIHVMPGSWYADSLAGDEIGPVVQRPQAGDLLFFHDTARGPWPVGSITHVGIAVDSAGMMADAGGGSVVHFRPYEANFPGLLVETRRPNALGGPPRSTHRTAITIIRGHAFSMLRGEHVRDLTIQFVRRAGAASSPAASQHRSRFEPAFPTMTQMMPRAGGGAGVSGGGASSAVVYGRGGNSAPGITHYAWEISINNHVVKPVHTVTVDIAFGGHRFKLFGHDHKAQHFLDGVQNDLTSIKLTVRNGAAHLWFNGAEIKPDHADVELMI